MTRLRRQWAAFGMVGMLLAAAAPALGAAKPAGSSPLLPGGNSKDPISIDADKLVYYDKDQKAVYSGNVIAIQGDSKLTCSVLVIFLNRAASQTADAGAPSRDGPLASGSGPGGSQLKRMEATGPVTLVSKTQVATGERAVYDKAEDKVWLIGNVTLSDGGNVTKGDKLTYDLSTGQAVVEVGQSSQRVHGQFIPSSNDGGPEKSVQPKKKLPDNPAAKQ